MTAERERMQPYRWNAESAAAWAALIHMTEVLDGGSIVVGDADLPDSLGGGVCCARPAAATGLDVDQAVILVDRRSSGYERLGVLAHELGHALDWWAGGNIQDDDAEAVAWLIAKALALTARAAVTVRRLEEKVSSGAAAA